MVITHIKLICCLQRIKCRLLCVYQKMEKKGAVIIERHRTGQIAERRNSILYDPSVRNMATFLELVVLSGCTALM